MAVTYSVSSVTARESAASADFTVKRSGTSSDLAGTSSVDFATGDASAVAGKEYVATSGTVAFDANQTEATVSVMILKEAYAESYSTSFLFTLADYGSASCTIVASGTSSTTQTYLYLPEDDESVTVPTADSPGDNLKYQALYSGFSDPGDTSVEMPLAYIRLGYASADMNEYERVILNSDNYHPRWYGYADDGTPEEWGPMQYQSLPRNIDRRDSTATEEESDNAHLDGLFLYSNHNYTLTVGKNYSHIVKGNYVAEVDGEGRLTWMDRKTEWVMDSGASAFRIASGVTEIDGQRTEYKITAIRSFEITAEQAIDYSFAAKYSVANDVEMHISNSAKYELTNSMKLDVGGLEIAGECDIYGNYSAKYPGGEIINTHSMFHQAASTSICLSIQTGYSSAWTASLQVAVGLQSAYSLLIGAIDGASAFRTGEEFYEDVKPDGLATEYSDAFSTVNLSVTVSFGVVTAALLIVACALQEIAEAVAVTMPKIEMTTAGMTLSCGATSSILMTAAGITITTPALAVTTTGTTAVTAPATEFNSALVSVVGGSLGIEEGLVVGDDAVVGGGIYGTVVEAV